MKIILLLLKRIQYTACAVLFFIYLLTRALRGVRGSG